MNIFSFIIAFLINLNTLIAIMYAIDYHLDGDIDIELLQKIPQTFIEVKDGKITWHSTDSEKRRCWWK